MHVIHPLTGELALLPEPWEMRLVAHWFLAAVFSPMDTGLGSQDAGAFLAAGQVLGHEGTDIESHTVVDVRLPADRLRLDGIPADEDVARRLAVKDRHQSLLQLKRRSEAILGTALTALYTILLAGDPIAEVAVNQRFEKLPPLPIAPGRACGS